MPASHRRTSTRSFVSLFNNGFSDQDFPASLVLQHLPELRFKPITRFENACASGSAAVYGARDFLGAGRGRFALVIGVEKMTATPGAAGRRHPAEGAATGRRKPTSRPVSPACSAASPTATSSATATSPTRWRRSRRRTTRTASTTPTRRCARTSASPSAARCREKNPYVAPPLKRTDCSLVSDGAAALVLTDEDTARGDGQGGALPRRGAGERSSCRSASATSPASRARPRPGGARWTPADVTLDRPVLRRIA